MLTKIYKKIFIISFIFGLHPEYGYAQKICLIKNRTLESVTVKPTTGDCVVGKALQLESPDNMDNTQYWVGSWLKGYVEQRTYFQIINDVCLSQRISEKRYTEVIAYSVEFNIKNPNLISDIPSYEKVPMTSIEASSEFQRLLEACRNAN